MKERLSDESPGSVSGYRLTVTLTVSFICVFLFLYLMFSASLMAAVTVSQVGGFTAEIEEVSGDDISFYPVASESSNCPDTRTGTQADPVEGEQVLPAMAVEVGSAEVDWFQDISFSKDIKTPELGVADAVRIEVTRPTNCCDDLVLGDATLHVTRIDAEQIDLQTDLEIEEMHDDQTFGDPDAFSVGGAFRFEGQGATVQNAEAVAHFVQFTELSISDITLEIDYLDESEDEIRVAGPPCPISVVFAGDFVEDPVGDGYTHAGDWVDVNTAINQGERRTFVYDEAGSGPTVRAGLRDEVATDPTRGSSALPGELILWTSVQGSGLYQPTDGEVFEIEVDYTDPNQIVVDVNDGEVVETYDASGDDEVYWSTYEWAGSGELRLIE